MFNNGDQRKHENVQLVLMDGRCVEGTLLLPMSSDARRALNGDSQVLEFLHADGRMSVVAKQAIVEIVLLNERQSARVAA
ncbi:MAG: hypothetical protein WBD37_06885 [Anderseniella sp.]